MPLHVCIFPQVYASTNETPLACLSLESNFNSLQMLFQAMLVKNYHTNTPIQNQAYFTYWSNWDIAYLFAIKIQERHLLSDLLSAHLLDCSILGAILISGEVQVDMANQAAGLHSFNFLPDCLSPICDTHWSFDSTWNSVSFYTHKFTMDSEMSTHSLQECLQSSVVKYGGSSYLLDIPVKHRQTVNNGIINLDISVDLSDT